MNLTQTFFVREIVRLRHSIASLERGLNDRSSSDPRLAGQRAMLDNERRCREYLLDLAAEMEDLLDLQMTLRIQYAAAKQVHDRCRYNHHQNGSVSCDDWWESLGKMQYLCHLNQSLSALMHDFTREERQEEIRRVTQHKDVGAAAQRAGLFRAIANAEGSASAKEYLVRYDVRHYNGSSGDARGAGPGEDRSASPHEPPLANGTRSADDAPDD
ncbi:MAG: hypothetical protein JXN59_05645 [Anaerolineae bacterium]|nr:hypothetical protein [Anaerolineae bacterium]